MPTDAATHVRFKNPWSLTSIDVRPDRAECRLWVWYRPVPSLLQHSPRRWRNCCNRTGLSRVFDLTPELWSSLGTTVVAVADRRSVEPVEHATGASVLGGHTARAG